MSFVSNAFSKSSCLLKQSQYLTSSIRHCLLSTSSTRLSITQDQLNEYEKDGFFVVRKLVKSESLEKFRKRFQKICSEKIRIPGFVLTRAYFILS